MSLNKQDALNPPVEPQQEPHTLPEEAELEAFLRKEYPREAAVYQQNGMNRRTFLKLMGASLALTGVGAACGPRRSGEKIIPYVRMPEEIIPGQPLFFATSMVLNGYANGVLIETHEGRPTRLEGNANHPASLGATDAIVQSSILDLYNPDRSVTIKQAGVESDWDTFVADLRDALGGINGPGLRILTSTTTSPTLANQVRDVRRQFPGATWVQYDPVTPDNVLEGSRLALGDVFESVYQFDQANIIVSLDANFLSTMPGSVRFAREFANGRKVRAETTMMSRLYALESSPTITGAAADNRLALKATQIEAFARSLAAALGVADVEAVDGDWSDDWLEAVVTDLEANTGASLVVAGPEQPPAVHALAHAINAQLGNVGTTVTYTSPAIANPGNQVADLVALVEDMQAGDVDGLIILGGNPAFNAPADVPFAEALADVPFSVHLSLYNDDTSQLTTWHVPATHFVEEWSDARAYDGSVSLVQPPIGALYDTARSAIEMLAAVLGDDRSGYQILRDYWQGEYSGDDFESFWRTSLHSGVMPDSAPNTVSLTLRGDFAAQLPAQTASSGLEVNFRVDPTIWDGRFANISWLQELPHPLTKLTWDNAALMSATTADELGVRDENVIELSYAGNTMRVPVLVSPSQADGAITVFLGYGHGLSADLEASQDFNAYQLRTTDAIYTATGVSASSTGSTYGLAISRTPGDGYGFDAVRSTTFETFVDSPDFTKVGKYAGKEQPDMLPDFEYEGYAWGMSIDLTSCIGCNACMIACQMENNIPTVGKAGVERARDMSWIRLDRYYQEEDGELRTNFQPLPCMHCEKAPCEIVCPVQATVHDHEGLNLMVYNRCVGTRYCSANCPYSVRRFNFLNYIEDDPIYEEVRNPNVSVRIEGVMEKCTFCVQRINSAHVAAGVDDRAIADGEIQPACASACPTQAITFGDQGDETTQVAQLKAQPHDYGLLEELNTKPRVTYLGKVFNPNDELAGE